MDIDSLINKYFEGETSLGEERKLRAYFKQGNLPEHLRTLAPIFSFLDDEQTALKALKEIAEITPTEIKGEKKKTALLRKLSFVAAIAACIVAVIFLSPIMKNDVTGGNYVWVDGVMVTNKEEVKMFAEKSLESVSTNEDIFLEQINSVFKETKGE